MKIVALAIAAALGITACGDSPSPLSRDADRGAISTNRGAGPPVKVALCHVTDDGDTVTITVPEKAVDAHLAHGDALGPCDACAPEPFVDPDGCSPDLLLRTPDQVIVDTFHHPPAPASGELVHPSRSWIPLSRSPIRRLQCSGR